MARVKAVGAIDPGALRHRLDLEEPVDFGDGQGGAVREWRHVTWLWARLETVSVKDGEVAGAMRQVTLHRVTLRHRADVRGGMRFRRFDRVFAILTATDSDGSGRYLACECEEVAI